MAWYIQVLEIADKEGRGTGKFRLTATSDEGGGGPYGLCEHTHNTPESAKQCLNAQREASAYGQLLN